MKIKVELIFINTETNTSIKKNLYWINEKNKKGNKRRQRLYFISFRLKIRDFFNYEKSGLSSFKIDYFFGLLKSQKSIVYNLDLNNLSDLK